jgi:hypothetical protein
VIIAKKKYKLKDYLLKLKIIFKKQYKKKKTLVVLSSHSSKVNVIGYLLWNLEIEKNIHTKPFNW